MSDAPASDHPQRELTRRLGYRTAKWLNDEERDWAVRRMGEFAPKGTDKHFDKDDFIATITAPMFWIFAVQYFFMTNSLNAFGYFAPTIISNIGFTGCELGSDERHRL